MSSPNVVVQSKYGPIIVNINDRFIAKSIVSRGSWAEHEIELMRQLIDVLLGTKKSVTVYDVGANVGSHTLALSKLFDDKIFIRAFEAQTMMHYSLCGTMALNNCRNVTCHHNAVSNKAEKLQFSLPDYNRENNFGGLELIKPHISDNENMILNGWEMVDCVTLDSFDEYVDMIKIDVEGMEHLVLDGAKKILEKCQPIILMEIFKSKGDDIVNMLKSINYIIYRWNENFTDIIAIPLDMGIRAQGLVEV